MKPLFHPALDDITVEGILHALADPVRVKIYADIVGAGCPQTCSAFLTVSDRNIPKATLSQHFRVLRESGLIRGEREGVTMKNTSRCAEIETKFPGLIRAIVQAHLTQMAAKKEPAKRKRNSPAAG